LIPGLCFTGEPLALEDMDLLSESCTDYLVVAILLAFMAVVGRFNPVDFYPNALLISFLGVASSIFF
jgi:hypothetical protein